MPLCEPTRFPVLGLGVGAWPAQVRELVASDALACDYAEVYADDVTALADLRAVVPADMSIVLHGSALSPGGGDPIPADLLAATREVADVLGAPWVLEDVAVWRLDGGRPAGSPFWPPVFDEDLLDLLAARVEPLSRALGRPFVCEVAPLDVFVGPLPVPDFYRRLVERTGAPLVLDVSHWLRYAQLVGSDPVALFVDFPMDHVIELHISGGVRRPGPRWYDEEHSAPLLPECVELLDQALARAPAARAVTVESHGAAADVVLHALDTVARLPSVGALRGRIAHGPSPVADGDRPSAADTAVLATPGPHRLVERQRLVRTVLEDPAHAAEAAARLPSTPAASFEEATRQRLRRLVELPVVTSFVLRHLGCDVGDALAACLRSTGRDAGSPPTTEELLGFLGHDASLPDWARDAARFDRDVLRVAAGCPPAQPAEPVEGGWLVSFDRSTVDTVNAVARGEPVPAAVPTLVRMAVVDGALVVEDVREAAAEA